jgi:peptidoglycan hydrolase CwlO-like protein
MKDRDRISNLEELIADILLRLDRLEDGQGRLEEGQMRLEDGQARLENGQAKLEKGQAKLEYGQAGLENAHGQTISRLDRMDGILGKLIENQMELSDRQGDFQEALLDLVKVVRKNSTDIEIIKDTMVTKETMAHFMEAMMNRFDRVDARFERVEQDIEILKLR